MRGAVMSDAAFDETPLPERRNRPVTIAHRLEYALARMLVGFFRIVGIDAASAIAGAFTRSVGPLLATRFPRWKENLARSARHFAGAGLDVFEKEPVDPGNPLLKLENVVASPHSAGTTWDTWFRRADFAYKNMKRVWEGEAPQAVATDYDM